MATSTNVGKMTRGALCNLATTEILDFLFSPQGVDTTIAVNYAKQVPIASSYERLHFQGTSNVTFQFELLVNRQIVAKRILSGSTASASSLFPKIRQEFNKHRNFLMALCYPQGKKNDVVRRSPPRALFLWPRFIAMEVVVRQLSFKDEMFAVDGSPIQFRASLQLEEIRDYRLTSAAARRQGLTRPAGLLKSLENSLVNDRKPIPFDPDALRQGNK